MLVGRGRDRVEEATAEADVVEDVESVIDVLEAVEAVEDSDESEELLNELELELTELDAAADDPVETAPEDVFPA